MISPIEKRCGHRDTHAFVAPDTVDLLGQKMIGIIADRRMTKMHRYLYLDKDGGTPRLFPGLRVWHGGYGGPTTVHKGQSVSVSLASSTRMFEGIGFHVSLDDATEEKAAERYHHPERHWLARRVDTTLVELTGWPGSTHRDDRIRVEYWNEHGVGQEVVIVFDDLDPVEEIAWTVKGDQLRQVYLDDEFCTVHARHFEHPEHVYDGQCARREATLAENLRVLADLDERSRSSDPATEAVSVQIGQVWADKQKGQEGRTVRVASTDCRYVYTELVTPADNSWSKAIVGRKSRILAAQFPKRFRLIPAAGKELR